MLGRPGAHFSTVQQVCWEVKIFPFLVLLYIYCDIRNRISISISFNRFDRTQEYFSLNNTSLNIKMNSTKVHDERAGL